MDNLLAKINPTAAERAAFSATTASFLQTINSKLKKATAILGGSGAKDTWLAGNYDVDIFVVFDLQKFADKDISAVLGKILRTTFPKIKIVTLHGSRDYFQLQYHHLKVEVIPILKITKAEQAKNITDISPLHSVWVNKHTQKLKKEIRLAKQFLRAQHLYGAESYILGLSGYVVEILIAYYGSFSNFLKSAVKWNEKEIIDVEQHYRGKDVLFELNQSKIQSPLIVIDPVDKSRNAAAAFSLEKFLQLKKIARAYLHHPAPEFFIPQRVDLDLLRAEAQRKKIDLVYLSLTPLSGKEDVIGVKLLNVYHYLQEQLAVFSIVKAGWEWDGGKTASFYFFLAKKELPREALHAGPPLHLQAFVADFKKKHKHSFIQEGKIMARITVDYPQLADFVKHLLTEKYLLEKIKSVKTVNIW